MRTKYIFLAVLLATALSSFGQVKSPAEFLRNQYGIQFTPNHLVMGYFDHLAMESDQIEKLNYGYTYEGRPLNLYFVSSAENIERLESIRQQHVAKTGLESNNVNEEDIAVVWLTFSVHGNEAGGTEASLKLAHELVTSKNSDSDKWLENTVVIIDPCANPDGNSRYSHWHIGVSNMVADPDLAAREHYEPWPGGRLNHYYYDLNRDWAWTSQEESLSRIKVYKKWMPHVHADVHEQFKDNPYYFAPGAIPFHMNISDWQLEFQTRIGKNSASLFDSNEWLYFTKEVFDLFYPSYGDTYPTFNGSIGMTYEQAGHSFSGRSVKMENGDTLTLQDRIDHHYMTSLSAIQISSEDAGELNDNFKKYFDVSSANPPGELKSYIISKDNPSTELADLAAYFDLHGIDYNALEKDVKVKAYSYQENTEVETTLQAGDMLVSAYQPLAILTQVLFEPNPELEDSLTYDITAWSIPHARGLKAFATETKIKSSKQYEIPTNKSVFTDEQPYALAIKWNCLNDASLIGDLLNEGVVVRYAEKQVQYEDKSFAPGTCFVMAADNRKNDTWYATSKKLIEQKGGMAWSLNSGWAQQGPDMGSSSFVLIKKPEVLLLAGDELDANSFGFAWHYFERVLGYPVTVVNKSNLVDAIESGLYNTMVIQDGRVSMDERTSSAVEAWLKKGGKLICSANAVRSVSSMNGIQLGEAKSLDFNLKRGEMSYSDRERAYIPAMIPGAIYRVELDESHPLAFGLGAHYFSLKTNTVQYSKMDNGWNVGVINDDLRRLGFAGHKVHEAQENTMVFGTQSYGRGSVVFFTDDLLYRGFWKRGQQLFANALFF
jgi:hypothetical protein